MPVATVEEKWAKALRGQAAGQDLGRIEPLLNARKEAIIAQAIASFNSRNPETKLTERDALLAIAALAENERLRQDLLYDISDGRKSIDKLKG